MNDHSETEPDVVAGGQHADVIARPHGHQAAPAAPADTGMHVPVRVHGQDLSGGHQGVHFTLYMLTGGQPGQAVQMALPRDYDRLEARVLTTAEPVILAQSKEMAEAPGNTAATITGPSGAYLPAGVERTLRNCDELWIAATSSTPTLVSVSVSRRLRPTPPNAG